MRKKIVLYCCLFFLAVLSVSGCMSKGDPGIAGGEPGTISGAPRLVIRGKTVSETDEALPGIRVAVYSVREETEQDIAGYNYAMTDSAGQYIIMRYRGRTLPAAITVVATDPAEVYEEHVGEFEVRYDSVNNGFVTADFVLVKR